LRRLDFPDFSAGVDEELAAVAAGDPVADLDNTDVVQRCRSAAVSVAQAVSHSLSTALLTSAAIMPLLLRLH
jgi:hypothetical protein